MANYTDQLDVAIGIELNAHSLASAGDHDPVGIMATTPPAVAPTTPVVVNVLPSPADLAESELLTFDILYATTRALVVITYPNLGLPELVHDGDNFTANYASSSTRSSITDGHRFSVLRAPLWPGPPTVTVFAFAGGVEL